MLPDISIAFATIYRPHDTLPFYEHVALTNDAVLARCGTYHRTTDSPCPIADNWVICRTPSTIVM